ncbi:MAG: hypothetical protein WBL95_04460 [Microcoleus sp.]
MTISASVKDGTISLLVYYESLNNTDSVYFEEMVILRNEECVTCYGVLSSASVGVVNFKERTWRPDSQIVTLKFHRKQKQQWDKDSNKFVTAAVVMDEAKIYSLLMKYGEATEGKVLCGSIKPWINPMYWELGTDSESDIALAERFIKTVFSLTPVEFRKKLKDTDIASAREQANKKFGSGGYSKSENTSEKIAANLAFLRAEFNGIFEFKNVRELAEGIEALPPASVPDFDYRVYVRMLQIIGILAGK